ncbi:hypothetical protein HMN09_00887300 [Mycena chlorophos]|uniref:F-box domain-containing protein n=1 Tax=Mycena chlorophos TaxID=658473 RepID=A0A8H6W7W9_MYCCL|nr:hypothetical protein HMN09_00887300 [Mycena chlorophos]
MFSYDELPTELWLEVFAHLDERSYVVSHAPFQPLPGVAAEGAVSRDMFTVVLVCKAWRAWAIELLYRNFKLSKNVKVPPAYGHWVRRAVVPYTTTATEIYARPMETEVLNLCPNLEVLVRPPYAPSRTRDPCFEFDATCPTLSQLKRLDWWNYIEASRSGGINSLASVLQRAPNIEYLFVGGAFSHFTAVAFHGLKSVICLPRLRTLRINISNALLLRHVMQRWELPALEHLVLDAPLVGVGTDLLWEAVGPRLSVVELGKHVRFLLEQHILPCLRASPQLRELNYYLFLTNAPTLAGDDSLSFPSVECVGVHVAHTPFMGMENGAEEWEHLGRHVEMWCSDALPNLRRVVVFGRRAALFADERWSAMRRRLEDRRIMLDVLE